MTYVQPVRPLDRWLWRLDEDGEWRHRLWREFDGSAEGHHWYERYSGDHDSTSLISGITWTTWGVGVDVDYGHESSWDAKARTYRPTRRTYVALRFGPFYVSLMWSRSRRGFDPRNGTFSR